MDYSKLSDLEINLRISEINYPGKNFTTAYSFGFPDGPPVQWIQGYGDFLKLDYCNNPADAWPIIHKYGISIAFDDYEQEWVAFTKFQFDRAGWNMSLEPEIYQHNVNPLRAAMIVYLMMQEGK